MTTHLKSPTRTAVSCAALADADAMIERKIDDVIGGDSVARARLLDRPFGKAVF